MRRSKQVLFYHRVGNGEHSRWNVEAKCLCGLEIDSKLELGRLHHRQLTWFFAFENAPSIIACLAIHLGRGWNECMTYFARAASTVGKKAAKPALSSVLRTRWSSPLRASFVPLRSTAASARPRAANTSAHDSGSARV